MIYVQIDEFHVEGICSDGLGLHVASFNPESHVGLGPFFEIWSTFLAVVLDMLGNLTPRLPGWTVGS